jgi:NADH-quinone oxidoreductase subunit C
MQSPEAILEQLQERFEGEIQELDRGPNDKSDPTIPVSRDAIRRVGEFLRDDPDLAFDSLMNLTAMELPESLRVVYHLHSLTHRHKITLRVEFSPLPTPCKDIWVPSLFEVWPVAAWMEREVWDLFGIHFSEHPDVYSRGVEGWSLTNEGRPRRLVLPHDWEGHPLRKDYQERPDFHGIPTTRRNPLEKGEQDG